MRIRVRIDGYAPTYRQPALAVVRKTARNARACIDGIYGPMRIVPHGAASYKTKTMVETLIMIVCLYLSYRLVRKPGQKFFYDD